LTRLERVVLLLERPGLQGIKLIACRPQATPGKLPVLHQCSFPKYVLLSRKTKCSAFKIEKNRSAKNEETVGGGTA